MSEITPSSSLPNAMRPEIAKRRIALFGKRFGQTHLNLAYHAAFPLALTPDLLYRLWANFPRNISGELLKIPWVAVADVLLSSLCDEVGHELYEMNMTTRTELLRELKVNPNFGQQRIIELSDFLLAYVQQRLNSSDSEIHDFAKAQQWTALAYTSPSEAALELALALRTSLEQNDLAEQVRMASLIETFVEPLGEFTPLLIYARSLRHLARGDAEDATTQFKRIARGKDAVEVEGIRLPIPEYIRAETAVVTSNLSGKSLEPTSSAAEQMSTSKSVTEPYQVEVLRQRTIAVIDKLTNKAREFELSSPAKTLDEHRLKLAENLYQVLLVGRAKQGKSTLLNALMGRDILPTNVNISTKRVFRIQASSKEAYRIRFEDESTKEITAADIPYYGSQTIADNRSMSNLNQIIRWIEIDTSAHFLPNGVSILDIPSLESLYSDKNQITQRFVPYADAVIFVLDSSQPISQSEVQFIDRVLNVTPNILFIQTKIDQYPRNDWHALLLRNEEILKEQFKTRLADTRIWPISNIMLMKAAQTGNETYQKISGYSELSTKLTDFLFPTSVWQHMIAALQVIKHYFQLEKRAFDVQIEGIEETSKRQTEAIQARLDEWLTIGDEINLIIVDLKALAPIEYATKIEQLTTFINTFASSEETPELPNKAETKRQIDFITRRALNRLAAALYSARLHLRGTATYILFVGGGTSTIQGHPLIDKLREQVLQERWGRLFTKEELTRMSHAEQVENFEQKWSNAPNTLKREHLTALRNRLIPTEGHMALGLLLAENYFPFVITTTLDQLIESTFISAQFTKGPPLHPWTVLINDPDRPEVVQRAVRFSTPKETTFIKLCEDGKSTFAVTHKEVESMIKPIENIVGEALKHDLVLIGLTPLDDFILQHFFQAGAAEGDGSITFINTELPSPELSRLLAPRNPLYIVNKDMSFDLALQTLAEQLKILQEFEQITGRTLDEGQFDLIDQATQVSLTRGETLVQIIQAEQQDIGSQPSSIISLVETTVFTINVEVNRRVSFQVKGGAFNYSSASSKEWNVNVAELNQFMQDMGHDIATYHRLQDPYGRESWRRHAKREGERLYNDLILGYPDLDRTLKVARLTASKDDPQNLTLVFNSPRDYLGMPFELLHDGKTPLAASHPLCRRVSGINVHHNEPFDTFVQNLRTRKQRLRVLLIASDMGSLSSDQEIAELQMLILQKAQHIQISVVIDSIPTAQATKEYIRKRLLHSTYHIVHYAGREYFDEGNDDNSGLVLWEKKNREGKHVTISARELASLLTKSETRLFYISESVGAGISNDQSLRNNDYLGTMDAIIQAGVPYVLGFRWHATDIDCRYFANLFYGHLFTHPLVPERAVWYARREIYDSMPTNETWTSPILVAQNPYQ